MASNTQNHQLDQITPVVFKFQGEQLYDRNVWRKIIQINQFNPQTQWKLIVDLGITELYDQIPVQNQVLEYLCLRNHRHAIEILIKHDIKKSLCFNWGLSGACQGGYKDLAQWMIDLGASDWNMGLFGSCQGRNQDLAQWMMDLGATTVNMFNAFFPRK